MGRICFYRIPAISVMVMSVVAFTFLIASGATCAFVDIVPAEGFFLEFQDGPFTEKVASTSIGLICESQYYDRPGDFMWELSTIFLIIAMLMALGTVILALALSFFVAPSVRNWRALSAFAAFSAVAQVPLFLIFEAEPCAEQVCEMSNGCYLVIISITCFVTVTLITQALDPPRWGDELDAWRVETKKIRRGPVFSDAAVAEEQMEEEEEALRNMNRITRWMMRRKWSVTMGRLNAGGGTNTLSNGSPSFDEEDPVDPRFVMEMSSLDNGDDKSLMLKMGSDGKPIGDDRKSFSTFGEINPNDFADIPLLLSETCSEEEKAEIDDVRLLDNEPPIQSDTNRNEVMRIVGHTTPEQEEVLERMKAAANSVKAVPPQPSMDPVESMKNHRGEMMLVVGHVDPDQAQIFSDPRAFRNDGEVVGEARQGLLPSSKAAAAGTGLGFVTGIRALTARLKNESKRKKAGYASLEEETTEHRPEESTPGRCPVSPRQPPMKEVVVEDSDNEYEPYDETNAAKNQQLMSDWDTLHGGNGKTAIVLPPGGLESSDDDEDEPKQVAYSSDGSEGAEGDGCFSDLSDDERDTAEDAEARKLRVRRIKQGKSQYRYSSVGSVASQSSLLDTSIVEETDAEIEELNEPEPLPVQRVQSMPAEVNNTIDEDLGDGYPLTNTKSYPPRNIPDSRSFGSECSPNSDVLHVAAVSRVVPVESNNKAAGLRHLSSQETKRLDRKDVHEVLSAIVSDDSGDDDFMSVEESI